MEALAQQQAQLKAEEEKEATELRKACLKSVPELLPEVPGLKDILRFKNRKGKSDLVEDASLLHQTVEMMENFEEHIPVAFVSVAKFIEKMRNVPGAANLQYCSRRCERRPLHFWRG